MTLGDPLWGSVTIHNIPTRMGLQFCTTFCLYIHFCRGYHLEIPSGYFCIVPHLGVIMITVCIIYQQTQCVLTYNDVSLVTDVIFLLAFWILVLSRAHEFLLESSELYLHNQSVSLL